jgi:hypothetical protein
MENDRNIFTCLFTIFARKKITPEHLNSRAGWPALEAGFDFLPIAGRPYKADQITKPALYQIFNHAGADETGGSCNQYAIIRADDEAIAYHAALDDVLASLGGGIKWSVRH